MNIQKHKKHMNKAFKHIGNISIIVGIILMALPFAYLLIYVPLVPNTVAFDGTPAQETKIITQKLTNANIFADYVPNINVNLSAISAHNYLQIPAIGIDTEIYEGTNASTLDKGVWRMPDHATPDDTISHQPIVLAAHRWGPDNATYEYRSKNLFLNLPNLNPGNEIKLNWNGKDYWFRITDKEESTYVSKYADLILLTCKYYYSDIRIIIYAQRI